jgi:hypothetical protein
MAARYDEKAALTDRYSYSTIIQEYLVNYAMMLPTPPGAVPSPVSVPPGIRPDRFS